MENNLTKSKMGEVRLVKGCMICHTEEILLATRNNTLMPDNGCILPQVCDECTKKYLIEGVLLINPNNANLAVIKDSLFLQLFENVKIPNGRVCYTDQKVLDLINSFKIEEEHA